ncbi:hypothetical protein H920_10787 [Fukomys damarensis]|uniref:Uncharacterized protein n=1 Tax=Fukomys damarensis TaxID=885580 RepID=A0A091D9P2_FUKDA|nr:hypothetical protein H920_10787 [Fukomys damarensis]
MEVMSAKNPQPPATSLRPVDHLPAMDWHQGFARSLTSPIQGRGDAGVWEVPPFSSVHLDPHIGPATLLHTAPPPLSYRLVLASEQIGTQTVFSARHGATLHALLSSPHAEKRLVTLSSPILLQRLTLAGTLSIPQSIPL